MADENSFEDKPTFKHAESADKDLERSHAVDPAEDARIM